MDKAPLSFFQQAIPDLFKADTNADIGNIFIALVYPHIQIIAYPETIWIGCQQSNVSIESDAYPLLKFLEEFPHVCSGIIAAHEGLIEQYEFYCRE
ncbi:hypothetical protein [Ralstonia solanacearum]|uniref:hypothetical protein n=1 Tax=Ralstonia solanacearum TaxID=305 RepID=UPI0005017360|nr:hypothetical protein [Ralstonia solanacearum]KFX27154.1 hypothetical protein KR96_19995 [Ralstonia solanacearum]KFX81384.1 hypothetical protein KR99_23590 [Ralstonia solanacearum]